ncbi:HlyD family efflux transporter periplasmic adaptor subunit [bacterium]|nr:HlyD family efflux transporter periplasmic adaptor subunit [bacterium]
MKATKVFLKTRKVLSITILIALIAIGYWTYNKFFSKPPQPSYVVANAKRGNIVRSVTGTGQVSASSQIDIKSKASGDLVFLNTKDNGTEIKKGTLIAQVDTRDVAISLENAKIAYAKLVKPADLPSTLEAENALSDAMASNKKSYDDAWNTVADTFTDLPTIMTGIDNLIYSQGSYLSEAQVRSVSQLAVDYQNKAGVSYDKAKKKYESLLLEYKNFSRTSPTNTIESFTNSVYLLTKDVSDAVKNIQSTLDYVRKQKNDGSGSTEATNISSWSSTINTDLANLLLAKTTITSTGENVKKKNADLIKLKTGPDSLDISAQKLNLQQAQNNYDDYFIRAPFDGVLARLSVKSTDTVSNGTVIGTLVSSQKIATITLNEVDVEKVRVGQKAELTFDAIQGLRIAGTVITVDLVGTISQGVVNYNVELSLDEQDERVKSGMSVTADITTETTQDVIIVPNNAVKTQGRMSYVEVFENPLPSIKGNTPVTSSIPPVQKRVEVGTSNDSFTEIISGINEGDQVVVRTITTAVVAKTTPTIFSAAGVGNRNLGGNTRPSTTGAPRN